MNDDPDSAIEALLSADPEDLSSDDWRLLAALARALEAFGADPTRRRAFAKCAPSDLPELKILWSMTTKAQKAAKSAASRSSRKKTMRVNTVGDFIARLERSAPKDDERVKIFNDLQSKDLAVTKDEMVAIAKGVLGRTYPTKKAALAALAAWFWHRVRGAEDAEKITRAGAR